MYTIYHIEGVKIGCSVNPKRRVKDQGYSSFQVLEVHEDIHVASKREIELQIEYGYNTDSCSYIKTLNTPTFESRSKGGKKNVENGHLASIRSAGGKTSGKILGPIQGKKNVENGHLASISGKGGKIIAAKVQTCPWCSKTIKGLNYLRWHGPRCKLAPVTT